MFHNKTQVYRDRSHAGAILADLLKNYDEAAITILAIPNGGVPVALSIYEKRKKHNIKTNFNLLIVRKIPIPYNTEAGFGAITIDGTIILNQPLVSRLGLNQDQISKQVELVMSQMKQRMKLYGIENQTFQLNDQIVLLIDDGLASGFTMIAAIKSVKKFHPAKIIVAIPTAPSSSIERISPLADEVLCPNIRDTTFFAVADAYKNWYDLEIEEVRALLKKHEIIA